jgi:hypothetical protein
MGCALAFHAREAGSNPVVRSNIESKDFVYLPKSDTGLACRGFESPGYNESRTIFNI